AAHARVRAAVPAHPGRRERTGAGPGRGCGRAGHQLRRPARLGHRGHPARPHGAARALGRPQRARASAQDSFRLRRLSMIRTALRGRPLGSGEGTTFPGLEAPPGDWTVERSYRYCEEIVRSHYENFPVASRFVPARLRPHMWAVYAYARSADDFADEPRFAGRRAQALEYWDHELHRCFHGEAEHPVFIALRDTAEKCDLPIT